MDNLAHVRCIGRHPMNLIAPWLVDSLAVSGGTVRARVKLRYLLAVTHYLIVQALFEFFYQIDWRRIQTIGQCCIDAYEVAKGDCPEQLLQQRLSFGSNDDRCRTPAGEQALRDFKSLLDTRMLQIATKVNDSVGFIDRLLGPTHELIVVELWVLVPPGDVFGIFIETDLPL